MRKKPEATPPPHPSLPIGSGVGRTNWILIALGLTACLALTLMMQQALQVRKERVADPVATEIQKALGSRLTGTARWRIRDGHGDEKTGTLTLQPTIGGRVDNLARDAGDIVWRRTRNQIGSLIVICDAGLGAASAFAVPPPWEPGRPLVRIESPADGGKVQEPPPPRSGPAPSSGTARPSAPR